MAKPAPLLTLDSLSNEGDVVALYTIVRRIELLGSDAIRYRLDVFKSQEGKKNAYAVEAYHLVPLGERGRVWSSLGDGATPYAEGLSEDLALSEALELVLARIKSPRPRPVPRRP